MVAVVAVIPESGSSAVVNDSRGGRLVGRPSIDRMVCALVMASCPNTRGLRRVHILIWSPRGDLWRHGLPLMVTMGEIFKSPEWARAELYRRK